MAKPKVMIVKVILGENGGKKGMMIQQNMQGDWNALEEIGVFKTLKQRVYENKLNKLFEKGGQNGRTD